ncbi:hypothetical protein MKW98_002425 [Papaver atlanticum]|uniref:Centromere protein X n=1 Tax=Papaver atlanticum TaxID=357466 RepID=A0AAD4XB19_9MAGN|nr:hypothetical protein MKW98_002425 [Papaver atlanticum]
MEDQHTLDPDLIHAIFKLVWNRKSLERERNEGTNNLDSEVGAGTSKKNRTTTANANALKMSSELLRLLVAEAVQRAATISDAEGASKIEATHLERILPQLLLDF